MARNPLRNWLRVTRKQGGVARRDLRVNRLEDRTVPANISGTIYQDWAANGVLNTNDPGIAGQVAYIDLNNNGSLDSSQTFTAADTPVDIPDYTGGVVGLANSIVTTSGLTGTLTDIDVNVSISHTWDSDLILTLVGPNGTRVILSNREGGSADNFVNTVFSDQASTAIAAGAAPFTGSFIPDEALDAFNGVDTTNLNGNWTLEVTDNAGGDVGTIDSFSVIIITSTAEPTAATDAAGLYTFAGFSAGNYTIRSVVDSAAQNATGPASYAVNLGASDVTGRDFGRTDKNAIYGVAFNDADNSGTLNGAETLTPGVTVYIDGNGNNQFDFQNQSITATDTPVDIPDYDNTTGTIGLATSSLSVSGFTQPLYKVTVTANITHTWDGDLILTLISPNGTRVILSNRHGGSGDNYTNTVFDDSAATAIGAGGNAAPFTGSFRPDEALSALNGLSGADVNGTWMLEVTDNQGADFGTIDGFTLELTGGDINAVTDALGDYKFSNVAPSTYSVRAVAPAGTTQTAPAGGAYSVTLAAGGTASNQDFGFNAGGGATTVTGVDVGSYYNSGLPNAAAQRSRIDQLRVNFGTTVTFTGNPSAAFSLQRTTGAVGPVGLNVVTSIESGHTVATLTFTDNTEFNSLVDGRYTLTVNAAGVQGLATNFTSSFHRRYGDVNGDERVDISDFGFFSSQYLLVDSSMPNFLSYLMFNIDSPGPQRIDITEFGQFSTRYLQPFTP